MRRTETEEGKEMDDLASASVNKWTDGHKRRQTNVVPGGGSASAVGVY